MMATMVMATAFACEEHAHCKQGKSTHYYLVYAFAAFVAAYLFFYFLEEG